MAKIVRYLYASVETLRIAYPTTCFVASLLQRAQTNGHKGPSTRGKHIHSERGSNRKVFNGLRGPSIVKPEERALPARKQWQEDRASSLESVLTAHSVVPPSTSYHKPSFPAEKGASPEDSIHKEEKRTTTCLKSDPGYHSQNALASNKQKPSQTYQNTCRTTRALQP
jgi:hypothetical protein